MKKKKTKQTSAAEYSTISLFFFLLDKLSYAIQNAIANGFFGKIFTSYSKEQEAFDQGFLKGHFQSGTKFKFYFRKIREYLSKEFEHSWFINKLSRLAMSLLALPLKAFGRFFFAFGAYTVLVYFVRWLLPDVADSQIGFAISGIVLCILALPMLYSKDNIAQALKNARITHSILIDGLGFREEAFSVETDTRRAKSNILFFLGMLLGLSTLFLNPITILLGIFVLIGICMILSNPEIGVIFALFFVPFLSALPSPAIFLGLLVLITSISYFIKLIRGKRILKIELLDLFVMFFLFAIYFSGAITAGGLNGYHEALLSAVLMLGYFLVVNLMRTEKWLRRCVLALVSSGTMVAVIGILQALLGKFTEGAWLDTDYFWDIKGRVVSVFENPNVLAAYLLLILPFAFLSWKQAEQKRTKFICFFSSSSILLCLLLTWSRGAWLATVALIVIFALLCSRKTLRKLFLLGFAAPLIPIFTPDSIARRLSSIGDLSDSSTLYRVYTWRGSMEVVRDYFWSGIGYGTSAYQEIYPMYAYAGIEAAQHSHNLFLQILLGVGIGGLLLFLTAMFLFAQMNLEYIKNTKDAKSRLMVISAVCAIAATLVMGLFDFVWYNYRIFFLFWAVLALGCACVRIGMNEQRRHAWQSEKAIHQASLDLTLS